MKNKKAKILMSLLLGIVTLNGVVSTKLFAKRVVPDGVHNKSKTAGVSCYLVGPPPVVVVPRKDEIEAQIKKLDTLYAENKINSETYNARKKALQEKLKDIESRDDGVDVNSIDDLKLGLKRIRYQYKMKKLTPEMYNDKRKYYMERIAYLEDKGLQRIDRRIKRLEDRYKDGTIKKEKYEIKMQVYEQERIYYQKHGSLNFSNSELEELGILRINKQIGYLDYYKRKLSILKRINARKK